jgi:hypothetical protein
MDQPEALELARALLRPTRALGSLVTRGPAWPALDKCADYKQAIGRVMGSAYCLLQPIWDEHPSLDPGSRFNDDPLGLQGEPKPPETTPAGLLPYLDETQRTLRRLLCRMLQDATIGRHKQFVEDSSQDLEEAIAQARCILEGNGIRSS